MLNPLQALIPLANPLPEDSSELLSGLSELLDTLSEELNELILEYNAAQGFTANTLSRFILLKSNLDLLGLRISDIKEELLASVIDISKGLQYFFRIPRLANFAAVQLQDGDSQATHLDHASLQLSAMQHILETSLPKVLYSKVLSSLLHTLLEKCIRQRVAVVRYLDAVVLSGDARQDARRNRELLRALDTTSLKKQDAAASEHMLQACTLILDDRLELLEAATGGATMTIAYSELLEHIDYAEALLLDILKHDAKRFEAAKVRGYKKRITSLNTLLEQHSQSLRHSTNAKDK